MKTVLWLNYDVPEQWHFSWTGTVSNSNISVNFVNKCEHQWTTNYPTIRPLIINSETDSRHDWSFPSFLFSLMNAIPCVFGFQLVQQKNTDCIKEKTIQQYFLISSTLINVSYFKDFAIFMMELKKPTRFHLKLIFI